MKQIYKTKLTYIILIIVFVSVGIYIKMIFFDVSRFNLRLGRYTITNSINGFNINYGKGSIGGNIKSAKISNGKIYLTFFYPKIYLMDKNEINLYSDEILKNQNLDINSEYLISELISNTIIGEIINNRINLRQNKIPYGLILSFKDNEINNYLPGLPDATFDYNGEILTGTCDSHDLKIMKQLYNSNIIDFENRKSDSIFLRPDEYYHDWIYGGKDKPQNIMLNIYSKIKLLK